MPEQTILDHYEVFDQDADQTHFMSDHAYEILSRLSTEELAQASIPVEPVEISDFAEQLRAKIEQDKKQYRFFVQRIPSSEDTFVAPFERGTTRLLRSACYGLKRVLHATS